MGIFSPLRTCDRETKHFLLMTQNVFSSSKWFAKNTNNSTRFVVFFLGEGEVDGGADKWGHVIVRITISTACRERSAIVEVTGTPVRTVSRAG